MTLDEAIEHCDEVSKSEACEECKNQHEQLKEWLVEYKGLKKYKEYFDRLYGEALEVANYHLNGDLEPLDNFIEDAEAEMEQESE